MLMNTYLSVNYDTIRRSNYSKLLKSKKKLKTAL